MPVKDEQGFSQSTRRMSSHHMQAISSARISSLRS
jgi:hypothetical protein